ncbi:MAG: GNAT family N-acetyltransferase [Pseudomonadota bacterium]
MNSITPNAKEEVPIRLQKSVKLFRSIYPEREADFHDEYFDWRYNRQFERGAHSVSICVGGRKVAHAGVFKQSINLHGSSYPLAQLGDLAVHSDHRSFATVLSIYRSLRKILDQEGYSCILTLPNERSRKLNQKFLNLKSLLEIKFTVGVFLPSLLSDNKVKHAIVKRVDLLPSQFLKFIDCHLAQQTNENGVIWTPTAFLNRMLDPNSDYQVSWLGGIGVVTTKHTRFAMPYVMIRAILVADPNLATKGHWRKLMGNVARKNSTPLYLYWGVNKNFSDLYSVSFFSKQLSKGTIVQTSSQIEAAGGLERLELIDVDIY